MCLLNFGELEDFGFAICSDFNHSVDHEFSRIVFLLGQINRSSKKCFALFSTGRWQDHQSWMNFDPADQSAKVLRIVRYDCSIFFRAVL